MARWKKHTTEQIVNLLRQVEVGVVNGNTLPLIYKPRRITNWTYSMTWLSLVSTSISVRSLPQCSLHSHVEKGSTEPLIAYRRVSRLTNRR
jgi:hypothetical protein